MNSKRNIPSHNNSAYFKLDQKQKTRFNSGFFLFYRDLPFRDWFFQSNLQEKSIKFLLSLEYRFKPDLLVYFEDRNVVVLQPQDLYKYEYPRYEHFLNFWESTYLFLDKYQKPIFDYPPYDTEKKFPFEENN